jgi:ATP-dependent protease ClpP protease subunit
MLQSRRPMNIPATPPRPMTYTRVLQEAGQHHVTRKALYEDLQKLLSSSPEKEDKVVVSFFTSFVYPWVHLNDPDAVMLEEVLQNVDLDGKELVLILNCHGGDALAAERMINICRSYNTSGYTVIIPKQAKSAATMVCLGARKLLMSATSELGPIDPQISDETSQYAAHEIIESYEELVQKANKTKGRIEPYLQQLNRFDARNIRWIRSAQQLSESIAVKALQTGAMKGKTASQVRKMIKPFLSPEYTKVHGRPIYHDVAKQCGLDVDVHELKSDIWRKVWDIYVRLNHVVSNPNNGASKVIESVNDHYETPLPPPMLGE